VDTVDQVLKKWDFDNEIKRFFLKGMLQGWAAGAPAEEISGMPGYKGFTFREGDFLLTDAYCVNKDSRRSAGSVTVLFKDDPVWVLLFGGYYEKKAIPFLKRALLENYKAGIFLGGRGPAHFKEGSLVYRNTMREGDHSIQFDASEFVIDSANYGRSLGYHVLHGIRLL